MYLTRYEPYTRLTKLQRDLDRLFGGDYKDGDVSFEVNAWSPAVDIKEEDKYQRIERFSGQFVRRFSVPDTVNADAVTAKTDKGVLKIVIPKAEKVLSKRIEVK